jgi:hypothetical protein
MAYRTIDENRVPSGIVFFGPTAADQTFESSTALIFNSGTETLYVNNLVINGTVSGGSPHAKSIGEYSTDGTINTDVALVTAGAAGVGLNLPSITHGKEVYVKKIDSAEGYVTVSGTIDGATSKTLYYQYESLGFVASTGTNSWYIV